VSSNSEKERLKQQQQQKLQSKLIEDSDESEEEQQALFEIEAVADYVARNDTEVSLKKGQKYSIYEIDSRKEWYLTEVDDMRAWLPAVYTKIVSNTEKTEDKKDKDDKKDDKVDSIKRDSKRKR